MAGGIEPAKQKPIAQSAPAPEAKKAEAPAAAGAAGAVAGAKPAGEGFDLQKKKLMSVSGRYVAPKEKPPEDLDLKDSVAAQRSAAQVGLAAPKPVAMTAGASGVNKTEDNKLSASGPISKKEWDNPQLLLSKLTQNPASGRTDADTDNSALRCGPSNVMAASIMNGPESTSKYLNNVANSPVNNRLDAGQKQELRDIADKVKNKTATFEDMGRAQDLTYKAGNRVMDVDKAVADAKEWPQSQNLDRFEMSELRNLEARPEWSEADRKKVGELVSKASGSPSRVVSDPDNPGKYLMTVEGDRTKTDRSSYTDKEVGDLAEIGGTKQQIAPMPVEGGIPGVFKDLKPGESAIVRCAAKADGSESNHFITVGRRKDGTAYIYNSDPSKGDATLVVGTKGDKQNADFNKQLQKYDDRVYPDKNGKMPQYTKVVPE